MEREELLNLVNDELGSTQLTLSEETINGELDDELENFGDDADANAKVVSKIAARLKRMDGQLHKDVSTEVKKLRNQKPKPKPNAKNAEEGGEGDETPAWFKKYQDEQNAKWEAAEAERKAAAQKVEREGIRKEVEKTLRKNFKDAGIEGNSYILRNVLASLDIPTEGADAAKIAKDAEKAYYKDLKEAGLGDGRKPQFGGGAGGSSTAQDAFFQRQKWYRDKHATKG